MSDRLILSELKLMTEHFTEQPAPDPEFMRAHASALTAAIESWAEYQPLSVRASARSTEGPLL